MLSLVTFGNLRHRPLILYFFSRKNLALQQVRVLAMTGYPCQENSQNIKAAGAELCLPKPVVVADLMEALGNISFPGAKK